MLKNKKTTQLKRGSLCASYVSAQSRGLTFIPGEFRIFGNPVRFLRALNALFRGGFCFFALRFFFETPITFSGLGSVFGFDSASSISPTHFSSTNGLIPGKGFNNSQSHAFSRENSSVLSREVEPVGASALTSRLEIGIIASFTRGPCIVRSLRFALIFVAKS